MQAHASADRASMPSLPQLPTSSELVGDLRSDHAGEYGAVVMYEAILAVSRSPEVKHFAREHMSTERQHLSYMEALLPVAQRSRLLPLWHVAGWLTGALPALFGERAVMVTIDAVETFVDRHYAAQLKLMEAQPSLDKLRTTLAGFRHDELCHRDDARSRLAAPPGWLGRVWQWAIDRGSSLAVALARRI